MSCIVRYPNIPNWIVHLASGPGKHTDTYIRWNMMPQWMSVSESINTLVCSVSSWCVSTEVPKTRCDIMWVSPLIV